MIYSDIKDYIRWYRDRYGAEPTVKLIEKFREVNGITESKTEGIDSAITYFEDAIETQTIPGEQKEHLTTALDALRHVKNEQERDI